MYEVMFFLPLFKVYKRQHGNFALFVNYRGGETLEVLGVGSGNLHEEISLNFLCQDSKILFLRRKMFHPNAG